MYASDANIQFDIFIKHLFGTSFVTANNKINIGTLPRKFLMTDI